MALCAVFMFLSSEVFQNNPIHSAAPAVRQVGAETTTRSDRLKNGARHTAVPCGNQTPRQMTGGVRNKKRKQPNRPICSRHSTALL